MKKEPEQFFHDLKRDITNYAELKVELLKLGAYERIGKIVAILSLGLILLLLLFFLILFIFIALGFFFSSWLGSYGAGFSLVVVLYLLLIGITLLFKKQIASQILNAVIDVLITNDQKDNDNDNTETTAAAGDTES